MNVRELKSSRNAHSIRFLAAVVLFLPSLNAQEPLTIDDLVANRTVWPREVTVNVAHQVPLLVNGKLSGSICSSPSKPRYMRNLKAT
jgi:hypothetical protein